MRIIPEIKNILLTAVNEEVEVNFPDDVQTITIQSETANEIRFAFNPGETLTRPYMSIKRKGTYGEPNTQFFGKLYFSCPEPEAFEAFPDGIYIQMLIWKF